MNAMQILGLMLAGLRTPRPVVAQVMAWRPGLRGALLLMLLAYLLESFVTAIVPRARGDIGDVSLIGLHAESFGLHCGLFLLFVSVGTWFGRLVGGTADFERVAVAVGWGFLVQTLLAPFIAVSLAFVTPEGAPPFVALVLLVATGVWLWLMASCIAEAHGFASTFAVAAVIFGLTIPVGLILAMILLATGAIPGPAAG